MFGISFSLSEAIILINNVQEMGEYWQKWQLTETTMKSKKKPLVMPFFDNFVHCFGIYHCEEQKQIYSTVFISLTKLYSVCLHLFLVFCLFVSSLSAKHAHSHISEWLVHEKMVILVVWLCHIHFDMVMWSKISVKMLHWSLTNSQEKSTKCLAWRCGYVHFYSWLIFKNRWNMFATHFAHSNIITTRQPTKHT